MAEEKRLTVGELRAALADAPDSATLGFFTEPEGFDLEFDDLVMEGSGTEPDNWAIYINLGISSPYLDQVLEMETELRDLRGTLADLSNQGAAAYRVIQEIVKRLADASNTGY